MNFFRKRVLILTLSILIMITNAVYAVEYTSDEEFSMGVQPEDGSLSKVETYGDFEYVSDDKGIYITGYRGSDSTVDIPSTINGQKVLIIYSETFAYCNTVKRVNIPATVNSIYNNAFINCDTIEWIEVDPANSTYASKDGILYDKDLQYLVVCPSGKKGTINIADGCLYVCDYSFFMCMNVTRVNVPASVEDIDQTTFWTTPALTNITIDRANKNYVMEDNILYAINNNVKTKVVKCLENRTAPVYLPSTITEIGKYAFYDCNKITGQINIPQNVEKIGEFAFAYCGSVNGTLMLPNSLKTMGTGAFMYCSNIEDISWGNSLTEIPERAFAYCTSLKKLDLPDSVDTIGNCAFLFCNNVESLKLGSNTRMIGDNSFGWMTALKGDLVIPDSTQVIGVAAFAESGLIDGYIVIGEKVFEIKESAFYSADKAKGIIFKGNAPIINAYTFLKPDSTYYHLANKYGFDGGYYTDRDIRIYSPNPTISFIADGKTYKTETLARYGMSVKEFENPVFSNLKFLGWYYDQNYTKEFKFTDTFMDNATIYAKTELKNILSFDEEEIKVEITEGAKLSVNYELEDGATYDDIVWSSQDSSVATVDSHGNVSGVGVGETIITATYKNAKATIKVVIWQDVDRLKFNEEKITIEVGDQVDLEYDYHFLNNGTIDDIEWVSSNDDIVSVENGKIIAYQEGNVTIAAMYKDIIATIDVIVIKPNNLDIVDNEKILRYNKGEIINLDIDCYFNDNATKDDIVYTSSNEDVVTIENNKLVQNGYGQAIVTASYKNVSDTIHISIIPQDNITFKKYGYMVKLSESLKLEYNYYFQNLPLEGITFTSSDENIATVDEDGTVNAISEGEVTITAQCGSVTGEVKIVVSPYSYLRGDMNFDGFVNSTDAAMVLDRFKNGDTKVIDIIVGDLAEDYFLNSTDAALILDIYKN